MGFLKRAKPTPYETLGVAMAAPKGLFDHDRRRVSHERQYGKQHKGRRQDEFGSWYARPTLVSCCLTTLLFLVGWIYLGWLA
jgi:hypothetical protein